MLCLPFKSGKRSIFCISLFIYNKQNIANDKLFTLIYFKLLLIVRCLIFNISIDYKKCIRKEFYMDIQESLGLRIQQLRKSAGISQEKFAILINMDRTYLASVESGKRNISLQNIKKIADGLGIKLEDLFKNID